ncbi:hypothetical protein [Flavobacterium flavipallidum]|uniref:Uncharacterized protein n=1 Tax=Flavobacterium flavipallidum TaxID=3139140 RepID=A0ABU9HNV8_9FLAO
MQLIPEIDFYINSFSNNPFVNRNLLNILFNKKNEFITNKQIINYIESKIDPNNQEYFQAFIKEIFDESRYITVSSLSIENYKNDVYNLYTNSKINYIVPIKFSENSEFRMDEFTNLLDLTNIKKNNYNYILNDLLSKGITCYDFSQFNDNSDVEEFFKNLLKIPKNIDIIHCFNRDYSSRFLINLKNKKINYFSLVSRDFPRNIYEYKEIKKELRTILGNKLEIFTTKKRTLIHERKIFIGGLSISFDNAFENILVEEPTWQITVEYCENKFNKWIEKKSQFHILN